MSWGVKPEDVLGKEGNMEVPTQEILARMPLAEGVLLLWRWVTQEERLQSIWDRFRQRCYDKIISFGVIVHLIADALLQYRGSGRRSFEKNIQNDLLEASVQAAYRKLGRLPLPVSQAFLEECTAALQAVFPGVCQRRLPASLQALRLTTLDGKALKHVAKRLLPLRGLAGGLLRGRALLAMDWATVLPGALEADADGEANEVRLVAALLPPLPAFGGRPRLWLSARACCGICALCHDRVSLRGSDGSVPSAGLDRRHAPGLHFPIRLLLVAVQADPSGPWLRGARTETRRRHPLHRKIV